MVCGVCGDGVVGIFLDWFMNVLMWFVLLVGCVGWFGLMVCWGGVCVVVVILVYFFCR